MATAAPLRGTSTHELHSIVGLHTTYIAPPCTQFVLLMSSPAATGGRDRSPSGHGVLASAVPTAPPAAVGEASPAGSGRPPSLPPPTPDSSVYGSHTRICAAPECNRILGSAFHDPHNVCITCRHDICYVDAQCPECLQWLPDLVAWASKHQLYMLR